MRTPQTPDKTAEDTVEDAPEATRSPVAEADAEADGAEAIRRLTRRRFLKRAVVAASALAVGDAVYGSNTLDVTHHRLSLPHLRAPLRVVQLSDLHRSWCVDEHFIARVVERANGLKPDLIALTGDFVTRHSDYIGSCLHQVKRLRAPRGLYAVLGNHDYQCDEFKGGAVIANALLDAHIGLLTNRSEMLDDNLRLVGVDDALCGRPDVNAAFADVRAGEAVLALTHNPKIFPHLVPHDCTVLAGHTHGGQINLPLLTNVLLHSRMRYKRGWYQEASGPAQMYVSRGLGVVGIPCRVRSFPEIAVFDLIPV